MNEAKKLRDALEEQLVKLRKECSHEKLSKWIDEYWAIAHGTGFQVQVCERCEEVIHRRTSCMDCGKSIVDDEIKDSKPIRMSEKAMKATGAIKAVHSLGGHYCETCSKKEGTWG